MTVETFHNLGAGYIRFQAEDAAGVLYEAWVYEDERPNRYGVNCAPVDFLPFDDVPHAVALAALRARPPLRGL